MRVVTGGPIVTCSCIHAHDKYTGHKDTAYSNITVCTHLPQGVFTPQTVGTKKTG